MTLAFASSVPLLARGPTITPAISKNSHRVHIHHAKVACPLTMSAAASERVETPPPRKGRGLIQHKREAFWFYRFLSIVYDTIVNPFHWTCAMRDRSLRQAHLEDNNGDLKVVDVGGGTGFCTEGIVQYVSPENVTLLDQSPHQMAKARQKESLNGVTFVEGDAESLPFSSGSYDRYVSAGSIEYWPEPQRGIAEAYRVIKNGGYATLIGPVRATNWFSRFWCDLWMLFPMESEYLKWFKSAGFENIQVSYIGPKAYKGVRSHGLIMGLTITGKKPANGPMTPKVQLGDMEESRDRNLSLSERIMFLPKWILGVVAGGYYFILPFVIMLYAAVFIRKQPQ
eukprot:Plantae.Rhodophyta-Hildenbrandia_rubra.ctg6553.p1 GENE.Plantae.Rhodophyta-Hildenbrandia_rubra.ctg6553~~Plantae.Rhodophyta-Hildenbrandia_rubra.ctg6553.p1  ORF type:complete len:340 (+),score=39.54 Plantae.Rhodophyta-Hildenbrandia_rubra.ctg6553:164-1183(+)